MFEWATIFNQRRCLCKKIKQTFSPFFSNNKNLFFLKFFGWILIELILRKRPSYNLELISSELARQISDDIELTNLIDSTLHPNPDERFTFQKVLVSLNRLLGVYYDCELIAQMNWMDVLKTGIQKNQFDLLKYDQMGRNLVHQCCIFGNVEMLSFLVEQYGVACLRICDNFGTTLTHFAGLKLCSKFVVNSVIFFSSKECKFGNLTIFKFSSIFVQQKGVQVSAKSSRPFNISQQQRVY